MGIEGRFVRGVDELLYFLRSQRNTVYFGGLRRPRESPEPNGRVRFEQATLDRLIEDASENADCVPDCTPSQFLVDRVTDQLFEMATWVGFEGSPEGPQGLLRRAPLSSAPFSTFAPLKRRGLGVEVVQFRGVVGGPDRDRTGDLFHAIVPTLSFSTTYKTPVAP